MGSQYLAAVPLACIAGHSARSGTLPDAPDTRRPCQCCGSFPFIRGRGGTVKSISTHPACCPTYEPCLRHVSPENATALASRALQVGTAEQGLLQETLEQRRISRRSLLRF